MRGILIVAACSVAIVACAGDDKPSPEEQLQGSWATDVDGCLYGFSFNDSDVYEIDFICGLQGGGAGIEAEVGAYAVDGPGKLRMIPKAGSCPEHVGDGGSGGFEVDGDTLRLVGTSKTVILRRLEKSMQQATGQDGVAEFGCWNDDATFTPGKLEKL